MNALISILCNFSVNLCGSCQIEYNEIIWVGTFALSGIANVTRALSSIGDPIGSTVGLALVRSSRARINTQRNIIIYARRYNGNTGLSRAALIGPDRISRDF